jgi:ribonuclease HII
MIQYSLLYPDLKIEKHKWYGTKKHKEYLTDKSKITWIHRISYKPVKEVLQRK